MTMRTVAILAFFFLLCAAVLSVLPVHGEAAIYDSVIRLHVLANSDSEADQRNKLAVRDALLPVAAEELGDCTGRAEAVAQETLRELGSPANVTVTLGQERYPTRAYEGFCFPSGEYLSLRVLIGEAEGQNWWCVLFPSLCLSVAEGGAKEELEEAFIAVGLTPEQYRVITESDEDATYKLRFKFLEILEKWRNERKGMSR